MKTDIKKVLFIVFAALSCCNLLVQAQQQSGGVVSAQDVQNQGTSDTAQQQQQQQQQATTAPPPAAASTTAAAQQPTTTATQAATTQDQSNNNPTTAANNPVAADTTTAAAVAPTNSNTDNAATQNNNNNNRKTNNGNNNTSVNANTDNAANPTGGSNTINDPSSPTQSNNQNQQQNQNQNNNDGDNDNKTPVIAGAVVGGIVGLAAIAGIFTWLNRRGGCTSRTRRRDLPRDYDAQDFDLKMAENNNATTDNSPSSPFQHARRFVPPTSGYMNLADEEYSTSGYHHSQSEPLYNDPYIQQQQHHQPYDQVYLNVNDNVQPYGTQDYLADNSTTTPASYYTPNSASPTLIASPAPLVATDNHGGMVPVSYHTPMKPDQVDQKPNAA